MIGRRVWLKPGGGVEPGESFPERTTAQISSVAVMPIV
jgi:hypothetical protein